MDSSHATQTHLSKKVCFHRVHISLISSHPLTCILDPPGVPQTHPGPITTTYDPNLSLSLAIPSSSPTTQFSIKQHLASPPNDSKPTTTHSITLMQKRCTKQPHMRRRCVDKRYHAYSAASHHDNDRHRYDRAQLSTPCPSRGQLQVAVRIIVCGLTLASRYHFMTKIPPFPRSSAALHVELRFSLDPYTA